LGVVAFFGVVCWCLAAFPAATCDQVNQQRESDSSTAVIQSIDQHS
jgi:hypothetical protein